jgi:hypothetical protein
VVASPTTTGDKASGRSTAALKIPDPGKRRRTIASAASTPKIVFAGTAIATRMSVTLRACTASGVVTACQAGQKP